MSEQNHAELFGQVLRDCRADAQESIADVSGATEIDVIRIARFESGKELPSEEEIMMFINHFSLDEEESRKMWMFAGYADSHERAYGTNKFNEIPEKTSMDVAYSFNSEEEASMEKRIMYTDMVHVSANNYGVVVDFLQGLGPNNQPATIARVGMSREHAKSVIQVLQQTLNMAENINTKKIPKKPKPTDKTDSK